MDEHLGQKEQQGQRSWGWQCPRMEGTEGSRGLSPGEMWAPPRASG